MSKSLPITPDVARALAEWSRLRVGGPLEPELTEVLEIFRQRVERLNAIDVEPFEFDFLHPLRDES